MSKDIRNIILVGHSASGKTTLAEAILASCQAIQKPGTVLQGTTVSDYNPDEIERKISINASFLFAERQGIRFYLVDTPGFADFVGELISGLHAVDGAILVVNATSGIEVGTERAWELLDKLNLPRLIFLNKIDKESAEVSKVIASLQERFGKGVVCLQAAQGTGAEVKAVNLLEEAQLSEEAAALKETLLEDAAEQEDSFLEKYLDQGSLTPEETQQGLKKGVLSRKLVPVLCGSALNQVGVDGLVKAVVTFLPSPEDRGPVSGKDPKTDQEASRQPTTGDPFSASVVKTISDPYVGQMTVFRVYSGSLAPESSVYNATRQAKEKVGKIFRLQGKAQQPVEKTEAGEIACILKLKETQTGDTLTDEKQQILFEPISFPEPAISVSVKPKTRQDEDRISDTLAKLVAEDKSFLSGRDPQTKELIISGLGDLHLAIMVGRLKSRYGVNVEIGTPKVAYKETVTRKVQVQGKHKKQSGGHGQYGDCWIELAPLPRGGDFEFVNKTVGGSIPRNFIPSVEKGVRKAMSEGALAGFPLVDIRVTVFDGSFHPVDSSDMAFQIAGAMALRKAVLEAGPVLLGPVMEVELQVPAETMGAVSGDLSSRRGKLLGTEAKSNTEFIRAQVPLSEMLKYAPDLKSITGGRGSYTMKFSHYEIVPQKFAQPIIQQVKVPVAEAVG